VVASSHIKLAHPAYAPHLSPSGVDRSRWEDFEYCAGCGSARGHVITDTGASATQGAPVFRSGGASPCCPLELRRLFFDRLLAQEERRQLWPELVWGFRCQGDFFAGRPSSIPPIAAGWHDCGESIEVEIDNDLEGFAGGIVA
jgi:hypothetical protein